MTIEALQNNFMDLTNDAVAIGQVFPGSVSPLVVYINEAFTTVFGYKPEDILGKSVNQLHDPDTWEEFTSEVQESFRAKIPKFVTQARLVRADGSKFWASVSFIVTENNDENQRFVCATFRDISDFKDAEDVARKALEAADFAHARLIAALNAYADPIVIYDEDLYLVSWNQGYADSVTDNPSDLVEGMHLRDVLKIASVSGKYPLAVGCESDWIDEILSASTLRQGVQDVELDGDVHHRLLRSRSSVGDYLVIRMNSTEFVRQKRSAEAAQERLIAALNAYPSPFAIYDGDDRLVVWNHAYQKSMTNDTEALRIGMTIDEAARLAVKAGIFTKARGREDEVMSAEYLQAEREKPVQDLELAGDIHHRLLRTRVENGDLVLLRIDTTELVRQRRAVEEHAAQLEIANDAITHKALHDDLTGLGNRRYLSNRFEKLIERRETSGGEIAALHIDLDWFKQINDTMGHPAGDQVLLDTSKRILNSTDKDDIVARIGGDEFVVLVHVEKNSNRPEQLAHLLLEQLSLPTFFEEKECRFGASIGLARTPLSDVGQLLTNSDVALYKAKRQGRGQLGIFDHSDLEELRHKKALADDIRRAVEHGEFLPFYHLQVDAATGKVVGMEALARWQHPKLGLLTPDKFLPVATDLNVVSDIDRMIFERGIVECQQAFGTWENPPSLSFNVSQKRVNGDEFEPIHALVKSYAGKVCFELLETIFLEEEDTEFLFQIDRLREIGVAIEVDDFGSGRASVVALQRIAPERLKIDRRLVSQVADSDSGLRLIRSIVEIGFALEMGVTAEGVETQEQADILADLGCDRLQGYLFAKPMAFDAMCRFLDIPVVDPPPAVPRRA